jgi:hypothetical protein
MARFNPQAFLAGMQSLMAPQQQAEQQIAQMRTQQMDRARENESLLNQRQMQGEQVRLQRTESDRAGERFNLEKDAADRQKAADKRTQDLQKLQTDAARAEAAKGYTAPVAKAKSALLAARNTYEAAKSRPLSMSRADYLKITTDLTKAQSDYETVLGEQKSLLKYVSPSYGFDETMFGEGLAPITPITWTEAAKAFKDAQSGKTGPVKKADSVVDSTTGLVVPSDVAPERSPEMAGLQGVPRLAGDTRLTPPSPIGAGAVEPGSMKPPVGSMQSLNLDPSTMNALSMLAPSSLGVGVSVPAGIGAIAPPKTVGKDGKPAVKLGKDGKPVPPSYAPNLLPPRAVRQRVYQESPDMILASDEEAEAQKIASDYATYIVNTFNLNPLDENFNEQYYRYVANPERFKRFTSRYGRALSIGFPEAAQSILAGAESIMLGQLGNNADVPTALRSALTDVATKTEALKEARSEAEYKRELRPLTIKEMKAKIAYYASGGSKSGKTEDPFKGIGGRTSAATMYGRSELIELDKLIQENEAALRKTKKDYPDKWGQWANMGGTETNKQQTIVNEARQVRAKIMTQQRALRQLIPNAAQFYSAFISFDPVSSIKNSDIAMRLRANVGPQAGDYIPYNNESPTTSPVPGVDEPLVELK